MSVLALTFPHLPPALQQTHIALFPNLDPRTASALRARLIAAASAPATEEGNAERERLNFAFLDARLLTGARHLKTGVHQALLAAARSLQGGVQGGMKTKTVHSEVLFALHPGGNIGDSIRKFGISPTTTSLLVLRVLPALPTSSPTASSAQERRTETLDKLLALFGEDASPPLAADLAPSSDEDDEGLEKLDRALRQLTDWKEVESVYKLGRDAEVLFEGKDGEQGEEDRRRTWAERVVTSMVAMKPVAA
ncbi:hypothetical protein OC834_003671 [Tilletia horrida]|nr:hypothetical protein OC834_003671 [Tilletia horrida]